MLQSATHTLKKKIIKALNHFYFAIQENIYISLSYLKSVTVSAIHWTTFSKPKSAAKWSALPSLKHNHYDFYQIKLQQNGVSLFGKFLVILPHLLLMSLKCLNFLFSIWPPLRLENMRTFFSNSRYLIKGKKKTKTDHFFL